MSQRLDKSLNNLCYSVSFMLAYKSPAWYMMLCPAQEIKKP